MKKTTIILVAMFLLMGCSKGGSGNDITGKNCDYKEYMGLWVNGKDRTHLSDRPKLSENIATEIIGVWMLHRKGVFLIW